MKYAFFIIFTVFRYFPADAQFCNYDYANDDQHPVAVDSGIVYTDRSDPPLEWDCDDVELVYDVYYPADYNFSSKPKLPAIFFIHGGGFSEGSNKGQSVKYCEDFARRNFIAVNMEYRTGRNHKDDCASATYLFAMYRAAQDVHAAIRKAVADQKSDNPPEYQMDLKGLYIGGSSAGAITALIVAYVDQKELNEAFAGIKSCLGTIKDTAHYLPPQNTVKYSINGVLSISGALIMKQTFVDADEPALISFHGAKDEVVNMKYDVSTICTTSDLPDDCPCNSYQMPAGKMGLLGPDSLDSRFNRLGICYEFYHDPEGGHVLSNNDWGLGTTESDTLHDYITERAACFFKSIRCGACSSDPALVDFNEDVNNTCEGYNRQIGYTESDDEFFEWTWEHNQLIILFRETGQAQAELYSVTGIRLAAGTGTELTFSLETFPAGLFIVRVMQGDHRAAIKVMKLPQ